MFSLPGQSHWRLLFVNELFLMPLLIKQFRESGKIDALI